MASPDPRNEISEHTERGLDWDLDRDKNVQMEQEIFYVMNK